jgi:hypothetical protein
MNKYFFTAHPVVTDDDGYLGYLWRGICFEDRKVSNKEDFMPIMTDKLFYSPKEAIEAIKSKYE